MLFNDECNARSFGASPWSARGVLGSYRLPTSLRIRHEAEATSALHRGFESRLRSAAVGHEVPSQSEAGRQSIWRGGRREEAEEEPDEANRRLQVRAHLALRR